MTSRRRRRTSSLPIALAIGAGVVGVGLVAAGWYYQNPEARRFAKTLPLLGRSYAEIILRAARAWGLDPKLLAAVIEQESGFGAYLQPRGPWGTGDKGFGHGLAQIDSRTWGAWLRAFNWRDPATNITKGAQILAQSLAAFPGNLQAGIAAYNTGPANVRKSLSKGLDPDTTTTRAAYSREVLARVERLRKNEQLA